MTDATTPWMGLDRDASVLHVGYGKVEELVAILAARIAASQFDAVVGISRSGIVPATMLSHRLGKELFLIRCQRHCDEISWMGTPPVGKSLLRVGRDYGNFGRNGIKVLNCNKKRKRQLGEFD